MHWALEARLKADRGTERYLRPVRLVSAATGGRFVLHPNSGWSSVDTRQTFFTSDGKTFANRADRVEVL